jgi:hypothetical protein
MVCRLNTKVEFYGGNATHLPPLHKILLDTIS